jgi:hypothetical protein
MKKSVVMRLKRETPGALLFESASGERVLDSVYIRKDALGGKKPEQIMVTIEAAD